ncbi:MAG: Crp/Fnr family transcriptional regulator [Pyrinomonadaceae bacterium]
MLAENLPPQNRLLAALSQEIYLPLRSKLERFELQLGETVYGPGDKFSHVYFVESGIIAMLAVADGHSSLEVAMVGNEGMVGLPVFLGIRTSGDRAVVQAPGIALRLKVADFREECLRFGELHDVMQKFTYAIIIQFARTAACNRFHSTEARMAKWLMKTQDRLRTDTFSITQEFLSYMLGVRREAINKIARDFQRSELISYSRGDFSITDRKGLESIACNCYQPIMN